jgi:hypothetical protein
MRRLTVLIFADVVVGFWLIVWLVETKLNEPYECDGVCQGGGVLAALLLMGLAYATWRTARARGAR